VYVPALVICGTAGFVAGEEEITVALADVFGCAGAVVPDPVTGGGTIAGTEVAGPVADESADEEVSVGSVGDVSGGELAGGDG
jgi:hypothetical protein